MQQAALTFPSLVRRLARGQLRIPLSRYNERNNANVNTQLATFVASTASYKAIFWKSLYKGAEFVWSSKMEMTDDFENNLDLQYV